MDQIKLLVKDVLHKIQDIPDIPFTTVRMSEITSTSSSPLHASYQSMTNIDTTNTDSQNNNDILDAGELILPKNEKFEKESTSGNMCVEVTTHIFPEVVEIRKASSTLNNVHIDNKGSHDSVYSVPDQSRALPSEGRQTQSKMKIIMGKRALLRSRSRDFHKDQAVVVHELVNEKYQDIITKCIDRIYHRRQSRESKGSDDDGTSSNYSTSSLRTPDSLYNGKSYFSLLFPQRSDSESADGSNRDLTNSRINSADGDDTSEYDPKKFLKSALGDISFDSQSTDMSLTNSRLQHSQSVDPLNGSTLYSKAGALYSSMRKSLRRACSFREKTSEQTFVKNKIKSRCQSFSPECLSSADLMRELYVQNGTIFQVSKAITFCRNSKDLASTEYIEAEKILLVASCQKEAIQAALDAIEFEERDNNSCKACSGTLELSEVIFYLNGDSSIEQQTPSKFNEYFVILVTSGKTVLSSKVLVSDKNGEIKSDKKFRVTALQTDFEVSVAVYSMKVDKHHGNDVKNHKKVPCSSTKSFFHLNHHKSSRKNLLVDNVASIQQSSFKLWGSCTVRCSDLQQTHFRMHHVPLCSPLEAYFTAVLSGDVKLTNRTSGFLTIGFEDHAHLIWNRRWCVLEGPLLKYWNYPSEEFTCHPLQVVNLAYAAEKSSPADRSICPRPKTLCLLIKNGDGLVLKYFLSTDSLEEKLSWQEEINFVIGTLDAWKCLCPKEQVTSC